jgi:thioredoxin 1
VKLNKTESMNTNQNGASTADLSETNFAAEVLQSKEPVLVVFWAPWSRACQALDSVLPELASALQGKARVVKVNADDSLDLSLLYDIHSIPILLYFVEGTPRLRIVGTAAKEAILAKLKPFGVTSETACLDKGTSGAGCQSGKEN